MDLAARSRLQKAAGIKLDYIRVSGSTFVRTKMANSAFDCTKIAGSTFDDTLGEVVGLRLCPHGRWSTPRPS